MDISKKQLTFTLFQVCISLEDAATAHAQLALQDFPHDIPSVPVYNRVAIFNHHILRTFQKIPDSGVLTIFAHVHGQIKRAGIIYLDLINPGMKVYTLQDCPDTKATAKVQVEWNKIQNSIEMEVTREDRNMFEMEKDTLQHKKTVYQRERFERGQQMMELNRQLSDRLGVEHVLKEQNEQLRKEIKKLERQLSSYKHIVDAEHQNFSDRSNTLNKQLSEYQNKIKILLLDNECLKQSFNDSHQELDRLLQELLDKEKILISTKNQNKMLSLQLDEKQFQINKLYKYLAAARMELHSKPQDYEPVIQPQTIKPVIEQREETPTKLSKFYNSYSYEFNSEQFKLKRLQHDLQTMENQLNLSQKEIEQLKNTIKQLKVQNHGYQLRLQMQLSHSLVSHLPPQTEVHRPPEPLFEGQQEAYEKRIADLKIKLEGIQAEKEQLSEDYRNLFQKCFNLEIEHARTSMHTAEHRDVIEQKDVQRIQKCLEENEKHYHQMKVSFAKELQEKEDELCNVLKEKQSLQTELMQLNLKLNIFQKQISEHDNEKKQWESENVLLKAQMERQRIEKEAKIDRQRQEISRLQLTLKETKQLSFEKQRFVRKEEDLISEKISFQSLKNYSSEKDILAQEVITQQQLEKQDNLPKQLSFIHPFLNIQVFPSIPQNPSKVQKKVDSFNPCQAYEQQIERLGIELTNIQLQMKQLKQRQQKAYLQTEKTKKQAHNLQEENNRLKASIQRQRQMAGLAMRHQRKKKIETDKSLIVETQNQSYDRIAKLLLVSQSNLQEQLDTQKKKTLSFKYDLQSAEEEIKRARADLREQVKMKEEAFQELHLAKIKFSQFKEQQIMALSSEQLESDKLRRVNKTLAAQVKDLHKALDNSEKNMLKLSNKNVDVILKGEIQKLKERTKELQCTILGKQSDNRKFQQQLLQLSNKQAQTQVNLSKQLEKCEYLTKQRDKYSSQLQQLQETFNKKSLEFIKLEGKHHYEQIRSQDLKNQLDKALSKIEGVDGRSLWLAKDSFENDNPPMLAKQLQLMRKKMKEVQDMNQQHKKEIQILITIKGEKQSQINVLNQEMHRKSAKINSLQSKMQSMENKLVAIVETHRHELSSQQQVFSAKLQSAKTQLTQFQAQRDSFLRKQEELEKLKEQSVIRENQLKSQVSNLLRQSSHINSEIGTLKEKYECSSTQNDSLEREVMALNNKLMQAKKELIDAEKGIRISRHNAELLETERNRINSQSSKFKQQLDFQSQQYDDLKQDMANLKNDYDVIKQKLRAKDLELTQTEIELQQLKRTKNHQLEHFNVKVREVQALKLRVSEISSHLEKAEEQIFIKEGEKMDISRSLREQNMASQSMEKELTRSIYRNDDLQKQVRTLLAQLQALKDQNFGVQKQKHGLEIEIQREMQKSNYEQVRYQQRLSQMAKEIEAKEQIVKTIEEKYRLSILQDNQKRLSVIKELGSVGCMTTKPSYQHANNMTLTVQPQIQPPPQTQIQTIIHTVEDTTALTKQRELVSHLTQEIENLKEEARVSLTIVEKENQKNVTAIGMLESQLMAVKALLIEKQDRCAELIRSSQETYERMASQLEDEKGQKDCLQQLLDELNADPNRIETLTNLVKDLEEDLMVIKQQNQFYQANYILKEESDLAIAMVENKSREQVNKVRAELNVDHFYAILEDCETLIDHFSHQHQHSDTCMGMKTRYGQQLLKLLQGN